MAEIIEAVEEIEIYPEEIGSSSKILMGIKWFFKKVYSVIKWVFIEIFSLIKWIFVKTFKILFWFAKKISIFLKKLLIIIVIPPFLVLKISYKVMRIIALRIWAIIKWFFTEDKITAALSISSRVKLAYRSFINSQGTSSETAVGVLKALFTLSAINEVVEEEV